MQRKRTAGADVLSRADYVRDAKDWDDEEAPVVQLRYMQRWLMHGLVACTRRKSCRGQHFEGGIYAIHHKRYKLGENIRPCGGIECNSTHEQ